MIIKRELGSKVTYRTFIPKGVSEEDFPKFGELTDNLYKALILFQKTQQTKVGFLGRGLKIINILTGSQRFKYPVYILG